MLDTAALEKRGIHTVTIAWDTFERAARIAARVNKVPDVAIAVIPHRRGTDTAEDQRAKARAIAPKVVEMLLGS